MMRPNEDEMWVSRSLGLAGERSIFFGFIDAEFGENFPKIEFLMLFLLLKIKKPSEFSQTNSSYRQSINGKKI